MRRVTIRWFPENFKLPKDARSNPERVFVHPCRLHTLGGGGGPQVLVTRISFVSNMKNPSAICPTWPSLSTVGRHIFAIVNVRCVHHVNLASRFGKATKGGHKHLTEIVRRFQEINEVVYEGCNGPTQPVFQSH